MGRERIDLLREFENNLILEEMKGEVKIAIALNKEDVLYIDEYGNGTEVTIRPIQELMYDILTEEEDKGLRKTLDIKNIIENPVVIGVDVYDIQGDSYEVDIKFRGSQSIHFKIGMLELDRKVT